MSKKNGNKPNTPRNNPKSKHINQGKKFKATLQKIKNFFNRDNLNIFTSVVSLLLAIVAIFLSCDANSFSRNLSPLTYSFEFKENKAANMTMPSNPDMLYNISDIVIKINNNPGKISNAYIATVCNEEESSFVDIRNCVQDSDNLIQFNEHFLLKYRYVVGNKTAKLSIGFNDFKEKYGHFFIIFKSYSGDYYYNVLHFITDDTPKDTDDNTIYLVDSKTDFLNINDIYDREKMTSLCNEINSKKDITSKVKLDQYINELENEYNLIKDKLGN